MLRRFAKVPLAVRVLCPVAAAVVVAGLVVVVCGRAAEVAPASAAVVGQTAVTGPKVSHDEPTSSAATTTTTPPSSSSVSKSSVASTSVPPPKAPETTKRVEAPWFADRVGTATQVISVVGAGGSNATVSTWRQAGGEWTPVLGGVAAKVGAPGISGSYGESSSATPAGVFAITQAFGRQADPGAGVSYLRVDDQDWWVSDVESPDYNTHQRCARGTCKFNERVSENLWEQGAVYDYALVMGVNAQRVPGGGSAFFLHVTNGAATAGCVAVPADTVVSIMRWVRPGTVIALR
ncbi:L,D-transpeptidase family protein [Lentzea sp. NPDC006480]|uniref:L,D-transpeptidase family protein n=1 Tax=Lentzea sp. NPDC006480 TaxID=3157176 RepID=UPI0033A0A8BD